MIECDSPEYRFDPVTKDPAESRAVRLVLFDLCANFWTPNEAYSAGEYVRPNRATGFAYQASAPGLSGAEEPRWPKTAGGQVVDGSLLWTAVAAADNGVNVVSAPSATAPSGITVSGVIVSESTNVLAVYSGGTDGQDYDVAFSFTIGGYVAVGRQTVRVRKR